jgi:phage terminase small subunit
MTKRKNTLKSTSELTLKQKAFVDIYVSNWGEISKTEAATRAGEISKTEAATRAGYTSAKKEGPTEIASRLTDPNKNPHVVRYMEMKYNQELKKQYKRFETLSKKAEDKKQFSVAVNAEYRSGQMAGFFIDKKEVTHVGLEGMSREQLEKRLSELEGKIGEAKNIIDVTPEEIT